MKKNNLKSQYRVNEQIRVREVRIVGDDIESTVMNTRDAIRLAEQKGVDLVDISIRTMICLALVRTLRRNIGIL